MSSRVFDDGDLAVVCLPDEAAPQAVAAGIRPTREGCKQHAAAGALEDAA